MRYIEFEQDLAAVLCIEPTKLVPDYKLDESNCWDSLAVVSALAMISRYFNRAASGEDLEKCETLQAIYDYVEALPGAM